MTRSQLTNITKMSTIAHSLIQSIKYRHKNQHKEDEEEDEEDEEYEEEEYDNNEYNEYEEDREQKTLSSLQTILSSSLSLIKSQSIACCMGSRLSILYRMMQKQQARNKKIRKIGRAYKLPTCRRSFESRDILVDFQTITESNQHMIAKERSYGTSGYTHTYEEPFIDLQTVATKLTLDTYEAIEEEQEELSGCWDMKARQQWFEGESERILRRGRKHLGLWGGWSDELDGQLEEESWIDEDDENYVRRKQHHNQHKENETKENVWEERTDEYGNVYFFNAFKGESAWEIPDSTDSESDSDSEGDSDSQDEHNQENQDWGYYT